jgi:hypothetical protein
MIAFSCPQCSRTFKVADTLAGKKTKCPGCGQLMIVPSAQQAPPPPQDFPAVDITPVKKPLKRGANFVSVFALLLAASAMPAAILLSMSLVGVGLAILAGLFALIGLLVCLVRRGAGIGFGLASLVVAVSAFYTALTVAGGPTGITRTILDSAGRAAGVSDLPQKLGLGDLGGRDLLAPPAAPPASASRGVADLIEHFKKAGLDGVYLDGSGMEALHLAPQQLGAEEGGSYMGDGLALFVYRFRDEAKARELEKSGLNGSPCHRNGPFVVMVQKGEDKVLPAFKKF